MKDLQPSLQYKMVRVNHATLGKPVTLLLGAISHWQHSDKANAVCIFTHAGIVPIKETEEQLETIINTAIAEGVTNV